MKTLILIRHAKSSWDDSTQTDFERTLNERGFHDASFMGRLLFKKNVVPDLIISSPANRAYTTAEIFASQLKYPAEKIKSDTRIYEATVRDLMEVIREVDDANETVLLFGHNPGIGNFTNLLGDEFINGMPTCSIAGIELNIDSWKNLERRCGKLIMFDYPKKNS
jgi:phosphohistidine phosphatase